MIEAIITGIISGTIASIIVAVVQFFLVRWLNKRMKYLERIRMLKCPNCGKQGVYELERGFNSCAFCGYIFSKDKE